MVWRRWSKAARILATEAEHVGASQSAAGQLVDIVTPTGGESVTEGTILEWSVKVGEAVKQGDTVVEVSTDKVDMELPAPVSGTLTEILAQDGETVTVGQVIGRMSAVAGASAARPAEPAAPPAAAGEGAVTSGAGAAPGEAGVDTTALREEVTAAIDEGTQEALAMPMPDPATATDRLFHEGDEILLGDGNAPWPTATACTSTPARCWCLVRRCARPSTPLCRSRSLPAITR